MEYIQDNPIPSASPPWGGQPYCNPFSKWENSSVCTWGIKIQLSRCEVHMHSMIPTRTPSYCPCRLLSVSRLHNLRKVRRGLHNKVSSEKWAEIGKYATEYKVISATADILHISDALETNNWTNDNTNDKTVNLQILMALNTLVATCHHEYGLASRARPHFMCKASCSWNWNLDKIPHQRTGVFTWTYYSLHVYKCVVEQWKSFTNCLHLYLG